MTVDPGLGNNLVLPCPDPFHPSVLFKQLEDADLVPEPLEGGFSGAPSEFYRSMDKVIFNHLNDTQASVVQPLLDEHPALAQVQYDIEDNERRNEVELVRKSEEAISINKGDITLNENWLAANPTANPVIRELTRQSIVQAKQINGILRLMLEKFDGTD